VAYFFVIKRMRHFEAYHAPLVGACAICWPSLS